MSKKAEDGFKKLFEGSDKCILKEYKVTNGLIYPILVSLTNKNRKVYVSANAKIVKVDGE